MLGGCTMTAGEKIVGLVDGTVRLVKYMKKNASYLSRVTMSDPARLVRDLNSVFDYRSRVHQK
jgi:hypothetical protein